MGERLTEILERVATGTTTERDALWLRWYIDELYSRIATQERMSQAVGHALREATGREVLMVTATVKEREI